ELIVAELLAEFLAGPFKLLEARIAIRSFLELARAWQQEVEHALFGILFGLFGDLGYLFFTDKIYGDLDEVPDHRFDVTPDVADLGKLGRLDFEKRRVGEPGEAAGNFGLTHAGRADHDDVLRYDVLGELLWQFLPAYSISEGDGDRALGSV